MTHHRWAGAASFTIYTRTKEFFRDHHLIDHRKLLGCSAVGGIGGAMAGSLISFGSAREFGCNPAYSLCLIVEMSDQPSNLSRCSGVHGAVSLYQPLTKMLSGSTAAGIRDCREKGGQVDQTAKYRCRCTRHLQGEWDFRVVYRFLPSFL